VLVRRYNAGSPVRRFLITIPAAIVDGVLPWYWALVATLTILCVLNAALLLAWAARPTL
jgi:hypothetical protein